MSIAIITINKAGRDLAKKLKAGFPDAEIFSNLTANKAALKKLVKRVFDEYDGLIFIAAAGITVRLVGPLAKNKLSDPAVVSIDSAGRFAISILSGHEGGANQLTFIAAACLGAMPVVTTGKDVHKRIIVGVGSRRGIKAAQVTLALRGALRKAKIGLNEIRLIATIDLKKNEHGLLRACADLKLPLVFISKEEIKNFNASISESKVARRYLGVRGVCEPCALLAGRRSKLIAKKEILNGVTVAIAKEN
ncbi:MAG: cobalamin biosynthesis protein [Candidatus Omnitrophota bacterium]|nr:cobalamin biosynthesis protein [Candidatus Omnitrophota bacterium]